MGAVCVPREGCVGGASRLEQTGDSGPRFGPLVSGPGAVTLDSAGLAHLALRLAARVMAERLTLISQPRLYS